MTEFDINHKAVSNAEYEVIGVGSAILPAPCSLEFFGTSLLHKS